MKMINKKHEGIRFNPSAGRCNLCTHERFTPYLIKPTFYFEMTQPCYI